ncbi:uncharacterized protein MAL13P1.304-like [Maniola jurtina]|uniref:uncharacterized protein MAL13P1.304-like n=1 Tax=Maniola jurtina TaxID=191418 RepID=UPI001E68A7A7|nr:uncharacterized protein MAL13P1.304-like [Maniola jurtina]
MNVNVDYAQYMIQKHQLAIALAVIQTKPDDVPYEVFIDNVKNKINERNKDSHLDITICEEDFNISDDIRQCDDQMTNGDDHIMDNDHTIGDELNKSHDSVNILNNFELTDFDDPPKENGDMSSLLDFMTELTNIGEKSEINSSQSTNFEETLEPVNIVSTKTKEIADNNRAACDTCMVNDHKIGNNTAEVINNTNHTNNNDNITSDNKPNNTTDLNKSLSNETYCESNNLTDRNKENGNNNNLNVHKLVKDSVNEMNIGSNNIDSQQTILYTFQGSTNNTHVSQSQEENLVMANKNLINKPKIASNDNLSNLNVKESTQNKKDELIDTNLNQNANNVVKNIYSEQDFENFYANNIEKLEQNTNKTNSMNVSQDYDHFDENDVSKVTIIGDKDEQRKHKNVENNSDSHRKRLKVDGNENFTKLGPNASNKNSLEINFDKNTGDDLLINSQNNDKTDFDTTGNRNKEPTVNRGKDNLTQDFEFLNSLSDLPDVSQIALNFNTDDTTDFDENASDNLFSPPSSQGLRSNLFCNTAFESTRNVSDRHNMKPNFNNTLFNTIAKEIIGKSNIKGINKENSINLDEPEDIVIENKRKESVSNTNNGMESVINLNHLSKDETLELISKLKENLRLKQCISNNLPNNETKEVISHQEKMKECISNNNTQLDIVRQNDLSDNETDTQSEIVPFKVLEDLSRIKCYLNRNDRKSEGIHNSVDSGFKSSQARSSYLSASQYSEVWKNESAHCLLSFVTDSQLSAKTAAIADEISTILGKLVDKLHEEEKYPIFLEELLEKVNSLLNNVYEGNNEESNALLKRQDVIYRLLLLNRSSHIIKYTIEKIITILEKTTSDIKEDVFELKHTNEAENICYIFHILEVLLKRFKKSNDSSQMSIQNTQDDDRILKKSSLTEIWRKTWNLTKSEVIEGSAKKACVLTKCGEVLNKLIVQAMDGYSLVSFAALQCFNLLQK